MCFYVESYKITFYCKTCIFSAMKNIEGAVVTAIGTPNIALTKYWGRRNADINLPYNSSLSITVDESLYTKTSVMFSDKLTRDYLFINAEEQDLNDPQNEKSVYTGRILKEMRSKAGMKSPAFVASYNSFPTAAGFASSASGASTLSFTVAKALGLELTNLEISTFCRKISGSACRSLFGGFAKWQKGEKDDGSDSYAEPVFDEKYWPEVIDVVTIIKANRKKVSTSEGHNRTPKTSLLFKARPAVAEDRTREIIEAIRVKDFDKMAEITMKDSNSMHATMMDSWPPIIYLDDRSIAVINAVHDLNASEGRNVAAYTFDAGPNPQIITLRKYEKKVLEILEPIAEKDKIIVAGQGSGPRLLKEGEGSLIDVDKLKPIPV